MGLIKDNQASVIALFDCCKSNEDIYKTLIQLGEMQPGLPEDSKVEENRVHGCQSQLYLVHEGTKDAIFFKSDSDALISKGLAHLFTKIYDGASAGEILQTKIDIFQKIDLLSILSPTRVNGLDSLDKKMKLIAVNYLV